MEDNVVYIKKFKFKDKDKISSPYNSFEDAQKGIRDVVNLLKKNKNEFNDEIFKNSLNTYLKKYHRILYSEVSVIIFNFYHSSNDEDNTDDNEIDNIIQNLTYLVNKIDLENETDDYGKILLKLLDHVLLAYKQYSVLATTEKSVKPIIANEINQFGQAIARHEKKLNGINVRYKKEIEKQKGDLLTQMISIVSIFVGIAFVMFGGMSLLNALFDFSNMKSVPLIELLCLGSLIGIIMIAVIYSFMIFILKLTNKELNGKSLLNGVLIAMIAILTFFCLLTFGIWVIDLNNSENIQKIYNEESIKIETNQTESDNKEENIKTDQGSNTSNPKENINQ